MFDELTLSFCYRNLTLKTGGFELTSTTITLVLQANRLTKCASHGFRPVVLYGFENCSLQAATKHVSQFKNLYQTITSQDFISGKDTFNIFNN